MKSNKMLKLPILSLLLLLLLLACAWSHPTNSQSADEVSQRSVLLIKTNANVEDAPKYEITRPRDVKPGEPCLTISWKTNPDGSGPDAPQIYFANGYFKIMPAKARQVQI